MTTGTTPSPPRRTWTRAAGIVPGAGVATIAGCSVAAALGAGPTGVLAVLVAGVAAGLLLTWRWGPAAAQGRVGAARADWVRAHPGAVLDPDGPASPQDVAFALPRGWRVDEARGRLRLVVHDVPVRAETWVLRAAGGSRRAPRRREVVATDVPTGTARAWVPLRTSADSMLVAPAWAREAGAREPDWLPAVRARLQEHEDLPAALTIGDGRVVLLALDDPRPATTHARAALVRDIRLLLG
ncbi:hypothetical protein ACFJIY_13505 [Pimelobacter simplex]|uniref:hypothetical protein n=1 Tax=Nocardioides simplex TaxID=2045 RepID=UPI00366D0CCB